MFQLPNIHEVEQALTPVVETLEQLGIPYCIGGSVASSFFGAQRQTNDVDLVVGMEDQHIAPLVSRLSSEYYCNAGAMQQAIHLHRSFNLIYLPIAYKIDVFPWKHGPFAQQQQQRARAVALVPGGRQFFIASPEDSVLAKIEWWKMGGKISTRQWQDVIGLLQSQTVPDVAYLRQTASLLGVTSELEEALRDAGNIP